MPEWHLRRAVQRDATGLARAIEQAYAPYKTRIPDLPDVSAGLDRDILDQTVWVVEQDGQIVGGVVLCVREDHAILANIAVDPAAGGQGLGRKLLATAEAHCRACNLLQMRLSTHVLMPENVALYLHLGWQETGREGSKVHMSKLIV